MSQQALCNLSASSQQFRSCQSESSCYYLVLRQPDPVGWCAAVSSRMDFSVSAVGYRAFVFAASRHFVAGNRSTECRGAVSVGASLLARGDASKILTVALRECPIQQGQTEKKRKNNS